MLQQPKIKKFAAKLKLQQKKVVLRRASEKGRVWSKHWTP